MVLKREDVLSLENGEVVQYSGKDPHGRDIYLLVNKVDVERGVVSGEIISAYGVNALTIDYLVKNGIRMAKWDRESELETKTNKANLSTHKLTEDILEEGNPAYDPEKDLSDEDWGPQGKHPFKHGGDPPHPNKKY